MTKSDSYRGLVRLHARMGAVGKVGTQLIASATRLITQQVKQVLFRTINP